MAIESFPILNGEAAILARSEAEAAEGTTHETIKAAAPEETRDLVDCDALVIGAGLSGIQSLYRLRRLGIRIKCFETADDFGGTWHWNRYPGVRVDLETPYYGLNIPEVYNTFNFREKFPHGDELRQYILHAANVLDLRKDVYFNARVNNASWDPQTTTWNVTTVQGHRARCRYLLLCTGALHRAFTPQFKGLESYKGVLCHSASYPEDLSVKGKKVIVVGTGASGVQIVQELGKQADHLTLLVRRPTFCLPMRQRLLTIDEQQDLKPLLASVYAYSRKTWAGLHATAPTVGAFDVTEEQRQEHYEHIWKIGGFRLSAALYQDCYTNPKANRTFYDFWKNKTRLRLTDPEKQKIMCPDEPPYYINTKRPPLEQDYYEVIDQPNVDVVNLMNNPIESFHEGGITLADGTSLDADVVVLATGFDSFTGSLTNMGLKDKYGVPIENIWAEKTILHLGMTVPGFPNMFAFYAPLSPSVFSNNTTLVEMQADMIAGVLEKMKEEKLRAIEAQRSAAEQWAAKVGKTASSTLYASTDSWWNASNIPGKIKQQLTYIKGMAAYEAECKAAFAKWDGFDVINE